MDNFWKIVRHLLGAVGIFLAMKFGNEQMWEMIFSLGLTAAMSIWSLVKNWTSGDRKEIWQGIARHLVTAIAGYLVYTGVITEAQSVDIIGYAVMIAGILASIFNRS